MKFRFDSILQLRRQERDEAGAAVGQAVEAIRHIDDQNESLRRERDALMKNASDERVGDVSVDGLLARGRYDLQLQADMQALAETRAKLNEELDRRQLALVEAEAEVKRFEKLRERELDAMRRQMLKREQAELDDAVSQRYATPRRPKPSHRRGFGAQGRFHSDGSQQPNLGSPRNE